MTIPRTHGIGRTETIGFRCTPEEREAITQAAAAEGCSVADLCRHALRRWIAKREAE